MNILLAIDGSTYTRHMLAYLAAHPELLGPSPRLTALTVVPAMPPGVTHHISHEALANYYDDMAEEILAPVLRFGAQHGWSLNALKEVGRPADTLTRVAEAGRYDLIVMGTHGHSTLKAIAMGSVTSGVLARCRVPALIVPDPQA